MSFTLGSITTSSCKTDWKRSFSPSKHLLQWKSMLLCNLPEMPLHLLWTHLRHCMHKIELHKTELSRTPFLQTPHGYSLESSIWYLLTRHCMTFVLPALTHRPFLSIPLSLSSPSPSHEIAVPWYSSCIIVVTNWIDQFIWFLYDNIIWKTKGHGPVSTQKYLSITFFLLMNGVEEAARARVRCAWAKFKELSPILTLTVTARGASYSMKGKI
jgi:hypothetical protein